MRTNRTIVEAIEDLAQASPERGFSFLKDRAGKIDQVIRYPFPDLFRLATERAGALQAAGLRKGDRLGMILAENADFVPCFLGALLAGIIPVPMYPPFGLSVLDSYLDHTRHILAVSEATAVLTTAKMKVILGGLYQGCPSLRTILTVESLAAEPGPWRAEKITLDDVAFLQFTSGSTARPKGVTLTHGNLSANIAAIRERMQLTVADTTVSWLPLFHDMGLIGFVLTPMFVQLNGVYLAPLAFLQRPVLWLDAVNRYRGTVSVVPNFGFALSVKRIKDEEVAGFDLSCWRINGCAAEPIRASDIEQFIEKFAPIGFRASALMPMYGMAESSLAISIVPCDTGMTWVVADGPRLRDEQKVVPPENPEHGVRIVSCGKIFDGHRLAIFAPDDALSENPLPDGQVGEIRLAGPSIMKGYWNNPEATRAVFAGEYLRTGDLGFLDKGEVMVCGRLKEMIIINGKNYFPQAIEEVAYGVPGVRKGNVVAFGTRDVWSREGGVERVVLALEVAEPEQFDETAVRRAVQTVLGVTLDDIVVLSPGQLPKTSSGKLQRLKARDLYEAGELKGRASARDTRPLAALKQIALSQVGHLKQIISAK